MDDFKPVTRYGITLYVSSDGRVRKPEMVCGGQNRKGLEYRPHIGNHGYFIISIRNKDEGVRRKFLVHRMVAEAHIANCDLSLTVNHKDGNKLNNDISNLEMCSQADNTKHQWSIGLVKASSWSKLTRDIIEDIRESKDVSRVAAKRHGITARYVRSIRNKGDKGWGPYSLLNPNYFN